ncbi:MAG: hypothetical protein ACFHWZ_05660 [Phycisphaerales bacterium]
MLFANRQSCTTLLPLLEVAWNAKSLDASPQSTKVLSTTSTTEFVQ